jgi:hypothetical protein
MRAALSLIRGAFNEPYLKALEISQLPLGELGSVFPDIAHQEARKDLGGNTKGLPDRGSLDIRKVLEAEFAFA